MFNAFRGEESPEPPKEKREIPFDGERFFAVEILKKKRAEVTLKDKSGAAVLDFGTLLPPKYTFELGPNWSSDHARKVIYIGPWNISRDALGLLHEIGHGWNEKDQIHLFNASYHLQPLAG